MDCVNDQVWLTQYAKGRVTIGFFSPVRWVVSIRYPITISTTRPGPSRPHLHAHKQTCSHPTRGTGVKVIVALSVGVNAGAVVHNVQM